MKNARYRLGRRLANPIRDRGSYCCTKVRMYGCNLYLLLIMEQMLGKPGASMYDPEDVVVCAVIGGGKNGLQLFLGWGLVQVHRYP